MTPSTPPLFDLASLLVHTSWCPASEVTTGYDLFRHCRYARCCNCCARVHGAIEPATAGQPAQPKEKTA